MTDTRFIAVPGSERTPAFGAIATRAADAEAWVEVTLKLARKTEWEMAGDFNIGFGQRLLATDTGEYPLLEIRTLELDVPGATPQ